MSLDVLILFIPTFLFVSLTPGMCMTLALTLGMSVGLRRSLAMMWGELVGVGLIAACAILGVAAIMLQFPTLFTAFKVLGGLYLAWLGVEMWQSRGRLALPEQPSQDISLRPLDLALRGFVTAIANPKGWAFMISLLPPFINQTAPILPQLAWMLAIILSIEFGSMLLYASGGQALRHLLLRQGNVLLLNRIAGTLMIGVGLWLIVG